MPSYYIKVIDGAAVSHLELTAPLAGYNTAADAATNGKPYLVPATLTKPTPEAWETLSGPVYDIEQGTITYTAVDKSADAMKAEKYAAINAARDALLAAGKQIGANTFDARLTTMGAIVAKRDRISRKGGAATKSVSGINTSTSVITVSGGAPADGVEILFSDVGGTTQLNGNVYITSDSSGNTFKIKTRLGAYVDMSSFGSYTSGGTATVVATAIDVSNNLVPLAFASFTSMCDALSAWHNDVFEQARAYKNAVSALSDAETIYNFDHSEWPS